MLIIEKRIGKLAALNISRVGKENDDKLILKCRFEATISDHAVRRAMGLDLIPDFWDENDEDRNPRYWSILNIDLEGKFKNQSLKFADIAFDSCEISAVSIEPLPKGEAAVSFTARIAFPAPDKVAAMASRLQDEFYLTVDAQPDLLEDNEGRGSDV